MHGRASQRCQDSVQEWIWVQEGQHRSGRLGKAHRALGILSEIDIGQVASGNISKTRGCCPVLSSTGQCDSAHSEGPPVECFHSTILVSIVCPSVLEL